MKKNILFLPLMALSLSACSLAPDFMLPDASKPAAFKEDLAASAGGSWKVGQPAAASDRGDWWTIFNDETLNKLEADAEAGNQSLAAMTASVKQARDLARIRDADKFPQINGDAGLKRQMLNGASVGAPGTVFKPETVYTANVGLSYELDLFGRVLNESRAAKADAQSAEASLQSMRLAMQADVAQYYFTIRGLDEEIKLFRNTLTLREDSLKILRKRLEVGTITELDVSQTIVDVENTRRQMHSAEQQRAQSEHALAVLLGKPPADFGLGNAPLAKDIPLVPAGIPSSVLERRPDITAAQYDLMAANARIGVARAAFFPDISLTATGGYGANSLGNLFDWSSRTWALGPILSLPIFSGGSAVANNERAKHAYEEAVANYRQQILVAFADVEDSLSRMKMLAEQAASQSIAHEAADKAALIAGRRYESGDTGYLEEITAKRDALDVSRLGIEIQYARLNETVTLIRALGGSWNAPSASDAAPVADTPSPAAKGAAAGTPVEQQRAETTKAIAPAEKAQAEPALAPLETPPAATAPIPAEKTPEASAPATAQPALPTEGNPDPQSDDTHFWNWFKSRDSEMNR